MDSAGRAPGKLAEVKSAVSSELAVILLFTITVVLSIIVYLFALLFL